LGKYYPAPANSYAGSIALAESYTDISPVAVSIADICISNSEPGRHRASKSDARADEFTRRDSDSQEKTTRSIARTLSREKITGSRLSLNQRRLRRVRLNLLPQMRDVNAQVLPMLFGFWPTNFTQKM